MLAYDLTPDALGGPPELRERRAHARAALDALTLPSTDLEEWRYSRIGELRLDAYTPVVAPPDGDVPSGGDGPVAAEVLLVDGHVRSIQVADDLAAKGLRVAVTDGGDVGGLGRALAGRDHTAQPFTVLNDAYGPAPVVVAVPAGMVVEQPVVIRSVLATPGGAAFPRVLVDAGADSEVTVVERQTSGDLAALAVPVTELVAGPAARLRYLVVQEHGPAVWQIASLAATAGQAATVAIAAAALGGDYARCRIDCRLDGSGATGLLDALYFARADQMLDFRTFQDHAAPDTTSRLLFKGAVDGRSRSVYTGLIRVRPEARGTNAFQTNRNLNLSEDAWAESVPNLEIENNDVRCSHASTVGPVDPDQRFYLESRGVPPAVAERLIVAGFFDEVLAQLPAVPAREAVRAAVAARLDAREERW